LNDDVVDLQEKYVNDLADLLRERVGLEMPEIVDPTSSVVLLVEDIAEENGIDTREVWDEYKDEFEARVERDLAEKLKELGSE